MNWDQFSNLLTNYPNLVAAYSALPYAVLAVLLVAGFVLVGWVFWNRKAGLSTAALLGGLVLVVVSTSGGILKKAANHAVIIARDRYCAKYGSHDGEHRVIISEFSVPGVSPDVETSRTSMFASVISEVLLEEIPDAFNAKPLASAAPKEGSPWRDGVGPQNYGEVMQKLHAFELIWGDVHEGSNVAKIFLALSHGIPEQPDLDLVAPLKDLALDDDPRKRQFEEGYHRLLGLVTFGLVVDTYRQATTTRGDQRKALFLKAGEQLQEARAKLNNDHEDPILKRYLFSNKLDDLIGAGLKEAGLSP
jgi:hypothetical protein